MTDTLRGASMPTMALDQYIRTICDTHDNWGKLAPTLAYLGATGQSFHLLMAVGMQEFPPERYPSIIQTTTRLPVVQVAEPDVIMLFHEVSRTPLPSDPRERAIWEAQLRNGTLGRRPDAVRAVLALAVEVGTGKLHNAMRARNGEALPQMEGTDGPFPRALLAAARALRNKGAS